MSNSKPVSFENIDQYYAIACNISHYRKIAGLTQDKLAEKAGISRSYLSSIEAPNMTVTFSFEVFFNIARSLNVEPYKLLKSPTDDD